MLATQVFARYAAQSRAQSLPPEVMHHAKRAVVDWYASVYPGLSAEPVPRLEEVLGDDLDHGHARLILGRPATPRAAALINGAAAHAAGEPCPSLRARRLPGAKRFRFRARRNSACRGLPWLHQARP